MARLSPGVFIEEVPSTVQVIQPVSASNLGTAGFTKKGPENDPILVTSFEQFTRIFGDLTKKSRLPLSMAAYYANGGRRAFVVRVVPDDAVAADGGVTDPIHGELITVGAGNLSRENVVPGSINGKYRSADSVVEDEKIAEAVTGGPTEFEGVLASLPSYDPELHSVVTATFKWAVGSDPGDERELIVAASPDFVVTETQAHGSVTIDLRNGVFSLKIDGDHAPDDGTDVEVDYTPATESRSITDDGAGLFTGDVSAGTIDYSTGEYDALALDPAAHAEARVVFSYSVESWSLVASSRGIWGDDVRLSIQGNDDWFDAATATFSRFNVEVLTLVEGSYVLNERFEAVDFTDPDSAFFFPDVVNELSDLLRVVEPGSNEAPTALSGMAISQTLVGGDESPANRAVTGTLYGTVSRRSLVISYTSGGVAREIRDDGTGNLIGDVDPSVPNTVNYSTGEVDFSTSDNIDAGTVVYASYSSSPAEEVHYEDLSGGSDGTFDSSNYGRGQFTSPTLIGPSQGIYALNKVEELMQVTIPDFVGDVTITLDLLDYVDGRADQPSGGDRFAVLAVPQGSTPQEAVDFLRYDLGRFSDFAALYWPWVRVADPLNDGRSITFPPVNHIAGIYARTDTNRNVGKSPGGTVDGALRFLTGLELVSTQGERDFVYPAKINPLVSGPQTGLAVWGVRTISSRSEWRYINARRLFMFVQRAIFNATHWAVFENVGETLWARIRGQLQGFLLNLFGEGYFAGNSPSQAFFVIVDDSNNPPEVIEQGQVIVDVGLAPNIPGEFIRFRFQHKTLD